jgi:hypothetical protein
MTRCAQYAMEAAADATAVKWQVSGRELAVTCKHPCSCLCRGKGPSP